MKKTIFSILGMLTLLVGAVSFMLKSNDHSECDTKIETGYNDNGDKVTTETHICKENYNM